MGPILNFLITTLAVSCVTIVSCLEQNLSNGSKLQAQSSNSVNTNHANNDNDKDVEARGASREISVRDIVERLHQLDKDIAALVNRSDVSMSPRFEELTYSDGAKSSERFTEVLSDLDALQDEINVLIRNVTRSRQYNLLVRLRPLNNIIYRVRHNMQLMRNSLIAIQAVTSLEKIGNSVLDSTLSVFLKPDAPEDNDGGAPIDENLPNQDIPIDIEPVDTSSSSSGSSRPTSDGSPIDSAGTSGAGLVDDLNMSSFQAHTSTVPASTAPPTVPLTEPPRRQPQPPPVVAPVRTPPAESPARRPGGRQRITTTTTTTAAPTTTTIASTTPTTTTNTTTTTTTTTPKLTTESVAASTVSFIINRPVSTPNAPPPRSQSRPNRRPSRPVATNTE